MKVTYHSDTHRKIGVNVKDFGAVGDGVSDNTEAIRNAEAYINSIGGGVLYFPKGTYKTKQFKLHSNITLVGDGIGKTVIKRIVDPNDSNTYNYNPINSGSTEYSRSFITVWDLSGTYNLAFKDLTIDGSGYDWGNTPADKDDPSRPDWSINNHNLFLYAVKNVLFENVASNDGMNFMIDIKHGIDIYGKNLYLHGDTQNQMTELGSTNTSGKKRWNQDGLHLNGVKNVYIYGIYVNSQDNSIAIHPNYDSFTDFRDKNNNIINLAENINIYGAVLEDKGIASCISPYYSRVTVNEDRDQIIQNIYIQGICKMWNTSPVKITAYNRVDEVNNTDELYARNIKLDVVIEGVQNQASTKGFVWLEADKTYKHIENIWINIQSKELNDINKTARLIRLDGEVTTQNIRNIIANMQSTHDNTEWTLSVLGAYNVKFNGNLLINKIGTFSAVRVDDSTLVDLGNLIIRNSDNSSGGGVVKLFNNSNEVYVKTVSKRGTTVEYDTSFTGDKATIYVDGISSVTYTSGKTLTKDERIVLADATSASITMTLPTDNNSWNGREITIIKTDSSANTVTINANSGQTFNNDTNTTSMTLSSQGSKIKLLYDESNSTWWVIG